MRRLSLWLRRRITGAIALAGLIVFVIFAATVLPGEARKAAAMNAGAGSPDLRLTYAPGQLSAMAGTYGPAGRAEFIRARWTFDLAFPLVYGFFFLTAITWLFGKGFRSDSPWQLANVVPLAAVAFDLLENTATSIVMAGYPNPAPLALALAPWFTLAKWILVGAAGALLVVGLVATVAGARRGRRVRS